MVSYLAFLNKLGTNGFNLLVNEVIHVNSKVMSVSSYVLILFPTPKSTFYLRISIGVRV